VRESGGGAPGPHRRPGAAATWGSWTARHDDRHRRIAANSNGHARVRVRGDAPGPVFRVAVAALLALCIVGLAARADAENPIAGSDPRPGPNERRHETGPAARRHRSAPLARGPATPHHRFRKAFQPDSTIHVAGTSIPTTYRTADEMSGTIPAHLLAGATRTDGGGPDPGRVVAPRGRLGSRSPSRCSPDASWSSPQPTRRSKPPVPARPPAELGGPPRGGQQRQRQRRAIRHQRGRPVHRIPIGSPSGTARRSSSSIGSGGVLDPLRRRTTRRPSTASPPSARTAASSVFESDRRPPNQLFRSTPGRAFSELRARQRERRR